MNTIFRHPKLTIRESPGKGVGVFSTDNIPAGTILMVEHALAGDQWSLFVCLMSQPRLLASLSPRIALPSNQTELRRIGYQKIGNNCFIDEETGLNMLGRNVNFFNHSCQSNAQWHKYSDNNHLDFISKGLYVFLKEDVATDTEITITYNCKVGHETGNFKCECGQSFEERKRNLQFDIDWCENQNMSKRINPYLELYRETLPEFLNTYRQNMNFEKFSLIDLVHYVPYDHKHIKSSADIGIKSVQVLNEIQSIFPKSVTLKGYKQIVEAKAKTTNLTVNLDRYISVAQASFNLVQQNGVDWV